MSYCPRRRCRRGRTTRTRPARRRRRSPRSARRRPISRRQVLRPDDDRRSSGAVDGHGVREAHGRAGTCRSLPARSASTGRRQDTGFAVYSAITPRDDSGDVRQAPSRRHARQAKPSAALDTFMSVQVRFGRATSSLSDLGSDRTMFCVAAPWNWTPGAGDPSLPTVA